MAARKKKTKAGAFSRLKNLGEGRLAYIQNELIKGTSTANLAEEIQQGWGECTDVAQASLSKMLNRYRKSELEGQIALYSKDPDMSEEQRSAILKDIETDLDAIGELSDLALAQKKRLKKYLLREEEMPVPLGFIKSEMRLLKDLLVDVARLQLETGKLSRASREVHGKLDIYDFSTEYRTMKKELDDRDEMAAATLAVMEELGLLEEDPDADTE